MNAKTIIFATLAAILFHTSCDVHEFPDVPETRPLHLRLNFDTHMTEWLHIYEDGGNLVEMGLGDTYDNARESGEIRYVIRTCPETQKSVSSNKYVQQFIFKNDVSEGYDTEFTLDLYPGDYRFMTWADLTEYDGGASYYNVNDFMGISLQGTHAGDDDYRDAFRGSDDIHIWDDILEHEADTLNLTMSRPLAKYEFITTDIKSFLFKEQTRVDEANKAGDMAETKVNIEDYKVVFYYVGFMPDTYSMFSDKPVDSATGVLFESKLNALNETEASLGFDYVFVNGVESAITVQIGVYDNEGTQIALTNSIQVPLKRSHHTILRGTFLSSKASGGVSVNPDFDGEYNLIFP